MSVVVLSVAVDVASVSQHGLSPAAWGGALGEENRYHPPPPPSRHLAKAFTVFNRRSQATHVPGVDLPAPGEDRGRLSNTASEM